ncbi:MAG: hypothetical protein LBJ67_14195 [Planctomycetaceae bacterium]|jgi:hypothetical protein|nr:hypothetical protein [Planctomycetaceae bacterium]
MKRSLILIFSLCLTTSFFVSGCSDKPVLGKIEGTVTYDGKPLEKGTIIFAVPGTREATGVIENGKIINVATFNDGDGVPIGEASVAIIALKEVKSLPAPKTSTLESETSPGQSIATAGMSGQEFSIPVKYVNPETSGLKATIQKGVNQIQFDLKK